MMTGTQCASASDGHTHQQWKPWNSWTCQATSVSTNCVKQRLLLYQPHTIHRDVNGSTNYWWGFGITIIAGSIAAIHEKNDNASTDDPPNIWRFTSRITRLFNWHSGIAQKDQHPVLSHGFPFFFGHPRSSQSSFSILKPLVLGIPNYGVPQTCLVGERFGVLTLWKPKGKAKFRWTSCAKLGFMGDITNYHYMNYKSIFEDFEDFGGCRLLTSF